MLKREIKILKYIKRHPDVARRTLFCKFPNFGQDYNHIKDYFDVEGDEPIIVDGIDTGEVQLTDESTYRLNYKGEQFFEDRLSKRLSFILPYGITTFIALVSAAPTIYKIFKFICNLFSQGTP